MALHFLWISKCLQGKWLSFSTVEDGLNISGVTEEWLREQAKDASVIDYHSKLVDRIKHQVISSRTTQKSAARFLEKRFQLSDPENLRVSFSIDLKEGVPRLN